MKIAVITNLYPPYNRGGAEQVVVNVISELKKQHEVLVITTKPNEGKNSGQPKITMEDKVKVYRFYPANLYFYAHDSKHNALVRLFWHIIDTFNFSAANKVKDILVKEKPDLVMTHNLKGISCQIPKVIRKLKIKHVHTLHDVQLAVPTGLIIKGKENTFMQKGFPTLIYAYFNKKAFGSPDLVISPSHFLLDYYLVKGFFPKSRTEVLTNPFIRIEKAIDRRKKDPNTTVFLYLGQVEKHKGVNFLIKAFRYLKDPTYRLLIAGQGKELKRIKLKSQLDNRIKVLGYVEHDNIPELFARADYTIVPSLCYENSPTVIFESFSYGVPVIASRLGGINELVKDGVNGLTFKANNMHHFQEMIDKISKLKRSELSAQARLTVSQFTVENYVAKLLNLAR